MENYYLAYGSNLNINSLRQRGVNANVVAPLNMKDYRLVYKGSSDDFAYLTIEKSMGDNVPLLLFEVSNQDIRLLDNYEGYPTLYSKYYIPIKIYDKEIKALIYVMNSGFDYHLPSKEYVEVVRDGYVDLAFDTKILDKAYKDTTANMNNNGKNLKLNL